MFHEQRTIELMPSINDVTGDPLKQSIFTRKFQKDITKDFKLKIKQPSLEVLSEMNAIGRIKNFGQ